MRRFAAIFSLMVLLCGNAAAQQDTVRMSLILPFKAATVPNNSAFDFYSGVLLALEEFGSDSVAVALEVYDSADSLGVPAGALIFNDIVMGPISAADIAPLARTLFWNKFLISPLDPACAPMTDTLKIIQAPTSQEIQIRRMAEWACENRSPEDSLVVVCEGNRYDPVQAVITDVLDTLGQAYALTSCDIFEDVDRIIGEKTGENGCNRIILASEREEFVKRITESVAVWDTLRTVNLYCPGKTRNFASISDSLRTAAGVRTVTAYSIDDTHPRTTAFIVRYKELYGAVPNSFAFQGYDLTRYFVSLKLKSGYHWFRKLEEYKMEGLQSDFSFERGLTGFRNTAVRRIEY